MVSFRRKKQEGKFRFSRKIPNWPMLHVIDLKHNFEKAFAFVPQLSNIWSIPIVCAELNQKSHSSQKCVLHALCLSVKPNRNNWPTV